MNRDEAFIAQWHEEKPAYQAWGRYLSRAVQDRLAPRIDPTPVSYFLKTAIEPRLKGDLKLVEKAFYRGKGYADPMRDITDKVGTRFVVLLGSHIAPVVDALQSLPDCTFSKDRDYELEQKRNPIAFDYAAVHFVVRNIADLEFEGARVPADTPCEVQIKTILQHAYSELTHDTIYKPQIQATPAMQRDAAKAMALLEATNDYFEKVFEQVTEALASAREITTALSSVYRDVTGLEPSPSQLEGILIEAYEASAGGDFRQRVQEMLGDRPFLVDRIKERVARRNPLFSQPSIFLAYLDIVRRGRRALASWPLTRQEMEPMLNDLGESAH